MGLSAKDLSLRPTAYSEIYTRLFDFQKSTSNDTDHGVMVNYKTYTYQKEAIIKQQ